jgi:hypothetical protein
LGEVVKNPTPKTVNLYLYQINPNPALRNQPLPDANPATTSRPIPLPIDLQYVLTVHPDQEAPNSDYPSQQVLGLLSFLLHDRPVFARRPTLGTDSQPSFTYRHAEGLRISLVPTSVDDLHKLWGALQVPVQLGFFFRVSVVFMARPDPPIIPAPVLYRGEGDHGWEVVPNVEPFGTFPRVDDWQLVTTDALEKQRHSPRQPIFEPGEQFRLTGANLAGRESTSIRIESGPGTLRSAESDEERQSTFLELVRFSPTALEVRAKKSVSSKPLRSGHYRIRVVCRDYKQPSDAERFRTSADFPLAIAPRFVSHDLGTVRKDAPLEIRFSPTPVGQDDVRLRFGTFDAKLKGPRYWLTLDKINPEQAGRFRARACINGVDSLPIIVREGTQRVVRPGPLITVEAE